MNDPLSLFEINVGLLSKVTLRAPKYIFYTSTSEIYSGLTSLADESSATISTPQHPRGAYIESKRCGEAILSHLSSPQTKSVSFRVALATPPSPGHASMPRSSPPRMLGRAAAHALERPLSQPPPTKARGLEEDTF